MKFNFKKSKTDDRLADLLKDRGLKNSEKRNLVIDFFLKTDRHYRVEELHEKLRRINPKISLSTVYRALKLLAACGLAYERKFDEKNCRFEPVHQKEHHDHLLCLQCGRIIEFENHRIERLQSEVAKEHKFSIVRHKLELYGYCQHCRRRQEDKEKR